MSKITQKKTRVRLSAEQKKQRAKKQAEARMHNSFKKKYHTIFTMASLIMAFLSLIEIRRWIAGKTGRCRCGGLPDLVSAGGGRRFPCGQC